MATGILCFTGIRYRGCLYGFLYVHGKPYTIGKNFDINKKIMSQVCTVSKMCIYLGLQEGEVASEASSKRPTTQFPFCHLITVQIDYHEQEESFRSDHQRGEVDAI